jgi:hypothetical protein
LLDAFFHGFDRTWDREGFVDMLSPQVTETTRVIAGCELSE